MDFAELTGKTLAKIEVLDERIIFTADDGTAYASYHLNDCCESAALQETRGRIDDVLGEPILKADESCDSESDKPSEWSESWTWTFQRLQTCGGEVTFVWLGEPPYFGLTHEE